MEKALLDLLHKNLYEVNSEHTNYKRWTFYEDLDNNAEFKYLKNLCSDNPEKFEIPDDQNLMKKICMMFSYNDFSYLENNKLIDHEIVGVIPKDSHIPILHIKVNKISDSETFLYKTKKHEFDFKIAKLSVEEQVCLIFHMIKTYKTETNQHNRKIKVNAYLDRLFFSENEKHPLINRICEFYNSLINDEYQGLENILQEKQSFDLEELLSFPLVFRRDIEIQLGLVYYKCAYYQKALEIFKKFELSREEIECLIALRETDLAIEKIKLEMSKIDVEKGFESKVLYCEYCIKLGWITENPEWFDEGFKAYPSFEPVEQKAIYYYKLKDFKNAKLTYETALKIVPQNERILFAYASVKILLEEYFECIDIFKRLLENDKRNPEYLRNLSLCYYKVEDFEKCMTNLKMNAVCDPKSMDMYFRLVIQTENKEEILWCISKLDDVRHIEPFIRFLISEKIINLEEAKEAFSKNPKLRDINFESWK